MAPSTARKDASTRSVASGFSLLADEKRTDSALSLLFAVKVSKCATLPFCRHISVLTLTLYTATACQGQARYRPAFRAEKSCFCE